MLERSASYVLASVYALMLARVIDYTPFGHFSRMSTTNGQTDWFMFVCFTFFVYFLMLRSTYKYWDQFDLPYASSKRNDCVGLELANLIYLFFNAVCMYFYPMPLLQVASYFSIPIAAHFILNATYYG